VPLIAESGLIWRPLAAPLIRRSLGVIHRRGITLTPAATNFITHLKRAAAGFRGE
jgi:DNA-binding transcriptional LysR family regulator